MPDLPPGPNRAFRVHLFGLHVRAGAPSPGTIAAEMPTAVRCSRTTVYSVFCQPRVTRRDPVMTVADVLVRRVRGTDMEAELDTVDTLWQEAWLDQSGLSGVFDSMASQEPSVPQITALDVRHCPVCEAPLFVPTDVAGRQRVYCSTHCRQAARRTAQQPQ